MYRFLAITLVVLSVVRISEADLITVPEFISEEYLVVDWEIDETPGFPGPPWQGGSYPGEIVIFAFHAYPVYHTFEDEWGTFTCEEDELEYVFRADLSFEMPNPYLAEETYGWFWDPDEWILDYHGENWSTTDEYYHVWQAVPEPGTLCVLGLAAAIVVRRHRQG